MLAPPSSSLSAPPEAETPLQRLRDHLHAAGLLIVDVRRDGNCFYWALLNSIRSWQRALPGEVWLGVLNFVSPHVPVEQRQSVVTERQRLLLSDQPHDDGDMRRCRTLVATHMEALEVAGLFKTHRAAKGSAFFRAASRTRSQRGDLGRPYRLWLAQVGVYAEELVVYAAALWLGVRIQVYSEGAGSASALYPLVSDSVRYGTNTAIPPLPIFVEPDRHYQSIVSEGLND